jgi:hypothetical protein
MIKMHFVSPRFSGFSERTCPLLNQFKPGQQAILSIKKYGPDQPPEYDMQLIEITGIEPHRGRTVSGLSVDRAHEKPLQTLDTVDLLRYQELLPRSYDRKGPETELLMGEWVRDHGHPDDPRHIILKMNALDIEAQPVAIDMRHGFQPVKPIAVEYDLWSIGEYARYAANQMTELAEKLHEATNRPFLKRLGDLFRARN